MAPWGSRSGKNCNIFEILGGAGDKYNSISMPNDCDGPYSDLGVYAIKERSAWAEVWTAPWLSRASIMAPEGRSWQICNIFDILGGAGDIYNSTSSANY